MQNFLFKTAATTALAGASCAAQACGFVSTDGGLASMFCIDDPLNILILSVLVGGICAIVPGLLRSVGILKRAHG